MIIRPRVRPLTDEQWLSRMLSEFTALPGLTLTVGQARRLWGLEPRSCQRLLSQLVSRGALARTPDGAFHRADRPVLLHQAEVRHSA